MRVESLRGRLTGMPRRLKEELGELLSSPSETHTFSQMPKYDLSLFSQKENKDVLIIRMNTLSIRRPRQSRCPSAPSLISTRQPPTVFQDQDSLQHFWTLVEKLRSHESLI